MPQDFTVGSDNQQIDKRRLENLQKLAKDRGEVFPYDIVTVYATKKLVDNKYLPEISKVGQAMEVHSAIADKLVEAGKATKDQPADVSDADLAKDLILKIGLAKTKDEVNALVPQTETRKSVKDAATKRLSEI